MGCEGYLVLSCRVYTASNVSLPTASSMGRYNDNIAYIMCDMLWTIELSFNLMRLFVGRWSPIIFHWLFFNQKIPNMEGVVCKTTNSQLKVVLS